MFRGKAIEQMPRWLYIDGVSTTSAAPPIAIPPDLQHVYLVNTLVDDWHTQQMDDQLSDAQLEVARSRVREGIQSARRTKSLNFFNKSTSPIEVAAPSSVPHSPASKTEEGEADDVQTTLALVSSHEQVLSTAARLYIHHLISFRSKVLIPGEQRLEQLRERHEEEMNSLLTSSTSVSGGQSGGHRSTSVVVTSSVLERLVSRHQDQLKEVEKENEKHVRDSLSRIRSEFLSFLRTAAADVSQALQTFSVASLEPVSPAGSPTTHYQKLSTDLDAFRLDQPGEEGSSAHPASPSSPSRSVPRVQYLRVPNPFISASVGKSREPSIAPIVFGVSPLSSLSSCLQLAVGDGGENEATLNKVELHLKRLGNFRHGGVCFFGTEEQFQGFLQHHAHDNPDVLQGAMPEKGRTVVRGRLIRRYRSYNLWGGPYLWHCDPSYLVTAAGSDTHATASGRPTNQFSRDEDDRCEEAEGGGGGGGGCCGHFDEDSSDVYSDLLICALQSAMAHDVDMMSLVLLRDDGTHHGGGGGASPSPQRPSYHHHNNRKSYLVTPLLRGLVNAIATVQMCMGGARQSSRSLLSPKLLQQGSRHTHLKTTDVSWPAPTIGAGGSSNPTTQRVGYNLGMKVRLFVPEAAVAVATSALGSAVEVL